MEESVTIEGWHTNLHIARTLIFYARSKRRHSSLGLCLLDEFRTSDLQLPLIVFVC